MKEIMLWLWQMPQHLLGLALWDAFKVLEETYDTQYFYGKWFITLKVPRFGLSLGRYVFLGMTHRNIDLRHEKGHSDQSMRWGPLYLLAIGLPSAAGNLWDRLFHKEWPAEKRIKWYYSRWPEKQADRLGGVAWDNGMRVCKPGF